MRCDRCGRPLADAGDKFCRECGAPVRREASVGAPVVLEVCCPDRITVGQAATARLRVRPNDSPGSSAIEAMTDEVWLLVGSSGGGGPGVMRLPLATDGPPTSSSITIRPDAIGLLEVAVTMLLCERRVWTGRFSTWVERPEVAPTIHVGHVASGEAVIAGGVTLNYGVGGAAGRQVLESSAAFRSVELQPASGRSSRTAAVRCVLSHARYGKWLCVGAVERTETSATFSVGRSADQAWPVAAESEASNSKISRRQGRVELHAEAVRWHALPTTNGSRVDKAPVAAGDLRTIDNGGLLSLADVVHYRASSVRHELDEPQRLRYLLYSRSHGSDEPIPQAARTACFTSENPQLHHGRAVLMTGTARIGSALHSELFLPESLDWHANLVCLAGRLWIEPASSTATVRVNGRRLSFAELAPLETAGTVVELGDERLTIEELSYVARETPPAA